VLNEGIVAPLDLMVDEFIPIDAGALGTLRQWGTWDGMNDMDPCGSHVSLEK
jgi:hypothetical protein